MLMTLQSYSRDWYQVFDRDLVVLEFDSVHRQAQNLLLRFKARIIERGTDVTTILFDCRGKRCLSLLFMLLSFESGHPGV
jgi:hypothetical protein